MSAILFKNYSKIAEMLKSVSMRRPYMTFSILMLREMIIKQTIEMEDELSEFIKLLRELENTSQNFLIDSSPIIKKYKQKSQSLNDKSYCDEMKESFDSETYENCLTYNQETMLRGFEANIFQILTNIYFLANQYRLLKDENIRVDSHLVNPSYQHSGNLYHDY